VLFVEIGFRREKAPDPHQIQFLTSNDNNGPASALIRVAIRVGCDAAEVTPS
jgi:hypothetical protein